MRKKRKSNKTRSDTSSKAKKTAAKKASKKVAAPKTRNSNTFSEGEFWGFIRAALRNRTRFWKPRLEALRKARRAYKGPNKRQKFEYQCSICKQWFLQRLVEVNHKIPAGSLKSAEDLPGFVERLFCEEQHLEVVCKKCHKEHHDKLKQDGNRE